MMWKYCKLFVLIFASVCFLICCKSKTKSDYNFLPNGTWYKLLAYENDKSITTDNVTIIKLNISCKTEKDSIFFDSNNNSGGLFVVDVKGRDVENIITKHCLKSNEGDSLELLVPIKTFYKQNFNLDKIPFFSIKDTVVKVNFRIVSFSYEKEYRHQLMESGDDELLEIEKYFGSKEKAVNAKDSLGFYWVEKPITTIDNVLTYGDNVIVNYKGGFINGRIIDYSPENFNFKVGTPDQLIKGLNYVISKLKLHQNAKIILPSRLAFGQNGNVFLNIPPFTPMLYEISIK